MHLKGTEEYDNSLKKAVLDYLSEFDSPMPDTGHRRILRNRLRTMVGVPIVEPRRPPRKKTR